MKGDAEATTTAVEDISFQDEAPDHGDVDRSPRWVWALVRSGPEASVWVRYPAEGHPPDVALRRARAPEPGSLGVVVLATPPQVATGADPFGFDERRGKYLRAAADESRRKVQAHDGASAPIHDDAYVDQRCGLVPKDVFLRLHRSGALPSKKVGHRVLARWGDVKAALAPESAPLVHPIPSASAPKQDDGLDALRLRVGLLPKGR